MITNLIAVAYLISTQTMMEAFPRSPNQQVEVTRNMIVVPYSFTVGEGIVIRNTNLVEIPPESRKWTERKTNAVTGEITWTEIPAPRRTTAMSPPPLPPMPEPSPPELREKVEKAARLRVLSVSTEPPPTPVIHIKRENGEVLTYRLENTPLPVKPAMSVKLNLKTHIGELEKPGDYCLTVADQGHKAVVIMACPFCAGLFVCKDHTIQNENPLTLSPSVVGPDEAPEPQHWEVLAPCKHHFFVKDGEATP